MLHIEVHIRWLHPITGDEPLKAQFVLDRVYLRDVQQPAQNRSRSATTRLIEHVVVDAPLRYICHQKQVSRHTCVVNDLQFVIESLTVLRAQGLSFQFFVSATT